MAFGAGEAAPALHYWLRHARAGNAEVDYVISRGDWIVPVEIKAGRSESTAVDARQVIARGVGQVPCRRQ